MVLVLASRIPRRVRPTLPLELNSITGGAANFCWSPKVLGPVNYPNMIVRAQSSTAKGS
jgi:hypothetical protein